jgi:hypothetical protein
MILLASITNYKEKSKKETAPVMDGLTYELYAAFWNIIVPYFSRLFTASLKTDT